MNYIPKKTKYKKQHRGKYSNKNVGFCNIENKTNIFFLKAKEYGEINSKQIEALRQIINKTTKRKGFFKIYIFSDIPVTKKPLEIRMGKGKGSVDHWVSKVKQGDIICYIKTMFTKLAIKALTSAQFRLPIKTKII
jgi:large subunit ribosomal protein L16